MLVSKTFILFCCTSTTPGLSVGDSTNAHRLSLIQELATGLNSAKGSISKKVPLDMQTDQNSISRPLPLLRQEPRVARHVDFAHVMKTRSASASVLSVPEQSNSLLQASKQAPVDLPSVPGLHTVVKYGVYLKRFHGISFDDGGWKADLIIATSWEDERAGRVINASGKLSQIFSGDDAAKNIWMPDIVITNLNFAKPVEISSSVIVSVTGEVIKVARTIVKLISDLDPTSFPFDDQTLKVRLASSTYMSDRLVMQPLLGEQYQGVADDAFEHTGVAWQLDSQEVKAIEETDGILQKSRGEFILKVTRKWQFFVTTVLLPELLLVMLAWTAFFFPLMPPFAMPKVASTMIPLLAMLGYMNRTSSMFPAKSAWLWICVYEEVCTEMLVFAIIGNLVTESTAYVFKNDSLAAAIRAETRVVYVVVTFVLLCVTIAGRHAGDFMVLAIVLRTIYLLILSAYVLQAMRRNYDEFNARAVAEPADPLTGAAQLEPAAAAVEAVEKPTEKADLAASS